MEDVNIYKNNQQAFRVSKDFPSFIFNMLGKKSSVYREEQQELYNCFALYLNGADFNVEGTSGDYIPSYIKFRKIKMLIDKEARFMFSQTPEIKISTTGETDEESTEKQSCENIEMAVTQVLKKSSFSKTLLQAAKDCFVGKRVACVVDYSDLDGVLVHFYNSLQFYYETQYGTNTLTKFVSFELVEDSTALSDKVYMINEYNNDNGVVYVKSELYNGGGALVETLVPETRTALEEIPAVVIINDGTLMNKKGMSDVLQLQDKESGYSKLANADIDSERKGMNPIRYTVDMNPATTSNLSSGAGAYWDLQHSDNVDSPSPQVGTLSPQMNHTEAVKTTLDRLNTSMYDALEIPNINEETMAGTITSGKALKALYYPLTVRCDEKYIVWEPAIEKVVDFIIKFLLLNARRCEVLYSVESLSMVAHEIQITKKYALLEDETEEKDTAINEVMNNVRSKKSYMKQYRDDLTTDAQIEEELLQIAEESNMMDAATNPVLRSELDKTETQTNIDDDLEAMQTEGEGNGTSEVQIEQIGTNAQ